jgi:hypothetical protein
MCKHSYAASWLRSSGHCPNLVPTDTDRHQFHDPNKKHRYLSTNATSFAVTVNYPNNASTWPSLAHLWSDWYRQYLDAIHEYPRIMIRFEDLLFHPKQVITQICHCAGGKVPISDNGQFVYVVGEGKWGKAHQGSSNMITAMIKYGTDKHRFTNMTMDDLRYAQTAIDPELLRLFQYKIP